MDNLSIAEKPVYEYLGYWPECGQAITIWPNDLVTANIGDSWFCRDSYGYSNIIDYEWTVIVTLVYKDDNRYLLQEQTSDTIRQIWVEVEYTQK